MTVEQAYSQQVVGYSADVVANIATIPALDVGNFRSGMVGGATGGALTFYASSSENGTYRLIENDASTDLALTLTNDRFAQLPEELFMGARWIKIVHGTSQVDLDLLLKS